VIKRDWYYYFGLPDPLAVFAFLFGGIGAYLVAAVISARYLAPVTSSCACARRRWSISKIREAL